MSLDLFLKDVKKNFAKTNPDIIFDGSKVIDFIKTGCMPFDLFIGGFPKSRVSEVFGMEHSGKSSLLLSTAAQIQRSGGLSIYLDFEGGFNREFAKKAFGLDVDNKTFLLLQPGNAEEGDELILKMIEHFEKIDALFVDSLTLIKSKEQLEARLGENKKIGAHAAVIAQLLPKLKDIAMRKNCAVVLVNQTRTAFNLNPYAAKVGLGNMDSSDQKTTGGDAPRFLASLRIKLSNKVIKEDAVDPVTNQSTKNIVTGNITTFKVIKSRVGIPFISCQSTFDLDTFGQTPGWNLKKDVMFYLKSFKLIEQRSAKFIYHGSCPDMDFTCSEGKEASEAIFLTRMDLIEDGMKQIRNLFTSKEGSQVVSSSLAVSADELDMEDGDDEDGVEMSVSA